MFGSELWFVYSIFSALFGGLYVFMTKVAVERDYEGTLFNTVSSVISAAILICIAGFVDGYALLSVILFSLILLNATLYMVGNVVRYDALRCIDTAIFYPLYKTLSPIFVVFFGVLFFSEWFTLYETLGLLLSLTVPLLLISSNENGRQKNLHRGIKLLVVSAFLASVSATALKVASSYGVGIWLLSAYAHGLMVIVGVLMLLRKKTVSQIYEKTSTELSSSYALLTLLTAFFHTFSFVFFMMALKVGSISLVYTVQSLYILIPIILSIVFYDEHWNARKVAAIALSIVALGLLK